MSKKIIFFILAIIFIALNIKVANASFLVLDLKTTQFGFNSLLDGTLTLNKTANYSAGSLFTATTNNKDYNISLSQWLSNSNFQYTLIKGYYIIDGNSWTSKQILNAKGNKIVGFNIPSSSKNIQNVSFTITGFGDLKIDLGNDNKFDWQYNGQQISWSEDIYPSGYSSNSVADSEAGITGANSIKRCEDLNITFNELLQTTKVKINVFAKKVISGADLNVSIANKECNIPDSNLNPNSFIKASCEVSIENPKSQVYQLCAFSKNGNSNTVYYKLPRFNTFYFMTMNMAIYNTTLDGNATIQDSKINSQIQNTLNKCTQQNCIIPINFVLENEGQLNIENILLRDKNYIDYTSMYDLNLVPDNIMVNNIKLPLSKFTDLKTPETKGNYNIKVSFENEISNFKEYNVTDIPIAVISTSSVIAGINQEITFSGANSESPNSQIAKYTWDFGDNQTATGSLVKHSYSKINNYTVALTVEDKLEIKGYSSIIIRIESLETSLPSLIDATAREILKAESALSSSSGTILETYKILGYDTLIKKANANISEIQLKYSTILNSNIQNKESQYNKLLNRINSLRKTVPISLNIDLQQIENDFPDITDIPSPEAFNENVSDTDSYKQNIYVFNQEKAKINTDIRKVYVIYIDGNETFTLVKKDISTSQTEINIIENFGSSNIEKIGILRPSNYKINDEFNLIEFFTSKEIVYKSKNLVGKTVVIPKLAQQESICGDNVCSIDENETSCPKDCEKKRPLGIFILLGVIVILGISYINFYKGPWNFKQLGNKISIKLRKKRLFTSQQDLINLSNYVRSVLNKGYKEEQIRLALIKKGWTNQQIDFAFKKARGMQNFK